MRVLVTFLLMAASTLVGSAQNFSSRWSGHANGLFWAANIWQNVNPI